MLSTLLLLAAVAAVQACMVVAVGLVVTGPRFQAPRVVVALVQKPF